MSKSFAFCEKCHAKLDPDKIWWLELDQRTGTYSDKEVPEEFSQGGFPFGKDCAKLMIAEHEKAITLLDAVLAPAVGRIEENRVTWTGEEPASMIAVWNDDEPDRVELKPKPAPQQNEAG